MKISNINELKLASIDYIDIYNNHLKNKVENGIHFKIPLNDVKLEVCKDPSTENQNINLNLIIKNNNIPFIKKVRQNELGSIKKIPFNKKNENVLYIEGINIINYDVDSTEEYSIIKITLNLKESKTLFNKFIKAENFLTIKYKQKIKTVESYNFYQTNKINENQKKLLEQSMYIISKIEESGHIDKTSLDESFKNLYFNFESFNQKDFLFKYELFFHDYINLLEDLSYTWELKTKENEIMSALDFFSEINENFFNFDINYTELINYHESIKLKYLFLFESMSSVKEPATTSIIYSNFLSYKDILKEFNNQLGKIKQL